MNLMISQVNNIENEQNTNRKHKHALRSAFVNSRRHDFEMKGHGSFGDNVGYLESD